MPTCFRDIVTLAYKPRIELGKFLFFFLPCKVRWTCPYIKVLEVTRSTQNFYFLKFCYDFYLLIKSM